jgi:DNA-binding CsgD family transcriptional regulator
LHRVLFLILTILWYTVDAQDSFVLKNEQENDLSYSVLPDKNFTIEYLLSNSELPFVENDSIFPAKHDAYWLKFKITNPSKYSASTVIRIFPFLNNVLYVQNADTRLWEAISAGIYVADDRTRDRGVLLVKLPGGQTSTLYVKVLTEPLKNCKCAIKPVINIKSQSQFDIRERGVLMTWIVGMIVLLLFFLNNIYIYVNFRDKTVFNFLIAQIGGMIYLTTYRRVTYLFFTSPIFEVSQVPDSGFIYYDFNSLFVRVGILMLIYGLTQMTRVYLATAHHFPQLDKILKWVMYSYLPMFFIIVIINLTFDNLGYYTLAFENAHVLILLLLLIYTCIQGNRKRLPAATVFLWINIIPMLLVSAIPVFHLFKSPESRHTDETIFPELAIISHALGFSIALVARMKFLQSSLRQTEAAARQLAYEIRESELAYENIELDNQKIISMLDEEKNWREILQQKLEANQRELASSTLYIAQKNEMMANLKRQLQELGKELPNKIKELKGVEDILQSNIYLHNDWEKFKIHLEQVHPHFFEELQAKYPSLTIYEQRLYAYFHIKLSTKEIAALLNIDPASVRQSKTRLYKKISDADREL